MVGMGVCFEDPLKCESISFNMIDDRISRGSAVWFG